MQLPMRKGEPMRIKIIFKSGYELPVTCDTFEIEKSMLTGEITGVKASEIKDNKLLFFRSEDIECIYRERLCDETD